MQIEPWSAKLAAERRTTGELARLQEVCAMVERDILADRDHLPKDVEYHTSLAECIHNLAVPKMIPIITYSVRLFGSITSRSLRYSTMQEHRRITDAIAARNGDEAAAVMREHIESNRRELESIQRELGAYRKDEEE